ncbi:MAG TPA: M20 family metallo-hydrolase [Steroidobacteraceae bacterium]|nr:M20 family metallo-hydrolase [Steroidobacteraceae bacterium]
MKAILTLLLLLPLSARAAGAAPAAAVQGARLVAHLGALAEYGKNPQGGVSRVAYSEADRAGREYVLGLMRAAGLAATVDAAGNLVGRRAGSDATLKPIVIGSHIDSVPEGGNYDGDVGSLGAIEVAQVLAERHLQLRHPLEVIVFGNEEGVMLGSAALAGPIDAARLDSMSQSGKRVRDGVRFVGGDPERLAEVRRPPGSVRAYLELHIEQGGVLERAQTQIGVVEGIVGILDAEVTVEGFANHAGTTPMAERRDALLAAARFVDKLNAVVTASPGAQVGTVGWLRAEPGAYNVVPGRVRLGMELRDLDAGKIERLYEQIRAAADAIGRQNGTSFRFERHALAAPALTDPALQALIAARAAARGLTTRRMPSGAGHDAQEMARIGPIGMIFIPSVGGISHAPQEYSRPGDIENGANVLLDTVLALDREPGGR